jgi:hypothetical protein
MDWWKSPSVRLIDAFGLYQSVPNHHQVSSEISHHPEGPGFGYFEEGGVILR